MWHDLDRFERSPVQTAPRNSFTSFWKISVPTIGCWTADNCLQIDSESFRSRLLSRFDQKPTDFDWLDIFASVLVASMRITNGVPRFQGQKFHYPRVCPGDQPLTKSRRNSGLEIGGCAEQLELRGILQSSRILHFQPFQVVIFNIFDNKFILSLFATLHLFCCPLYSPQNVFKLRALISAWELAWMKRVRF